MSSSTVLYDGAEQEDEALRSVAELLASPRWNLAAPLAERLASGGRRGGARQRVERWKAQPAFVKNPGLWEQRLAAQGITEEDLLVEPPDGSPAWLKSLADAYGDGGTTPEFPWPERIDRERCRFLPFVEPLVWHFFAKLELEARRYRHAPFTPESVRMLTAHLPDHFAPMLNRTMLVEMHVLKLEEQLAGDTPEARFDDFLGKLRDKRYALEILERFPVLARQLVQRMEHWLAACAELLERLAADAEALEIRGTLADVYGALSDFHRGGRSVFILLFDDGMELVYKPKPLGLEAAFQKLLGWINSKGFEPPLRETRVVDRGDYGWMEMVHAAPCEDDAALRRFLQRQGAYLALIYLLDGTDFHHENVLAAGEHPVLIDLETLFQPWLNVPDLQRPDDAAGAPLRATVLRANMLPERWWGDGANAGVDLSGLTAQEGQLTPRPMLATADTGRDTMRMERRRMSIPAGENRARVHGREVTVNEFAEPLEAGFRRMYALLLEHRQELLGQLQSFAGCEVRLLFRNTMHYGTVLLESLHPHALGNAVDRDRLFDGLWNFVPKRPFLARLAALEVEDLHAGDIPLFITYPESRDAMHWRGTTFRDFFAESGLARAERRVRELSQSDCERQIAVIQDSFDALRLSSHEVGRPSYTLTPGRTTREELLALARQAADRLVERAFTNEREAHWLTLDYRDPNGWQLVPTGPDVYLGLTGVAFFLGYFGAATGDARYTDVARKAIAAQKHQLVLDPKNVKGIGGYNGWGGIIYTLAHLGRLWNDEALLDEAESYADRLPELIAADDLLDVVVGSAGALLSLEALAAVRPSGKLDALMRACGERILARQEPAGGWRMPIAGDRMLAGFSHGAAGIALALLHLYGRTGDVRYREAAQRGMEYERSLFSAVEQNWPDLRAGADVGVDSSDGHHYMWAWCHGAPGIGLARIAGLPWLDDAEVRREIDVAVRSTIEHGFGENHSLCHGDLGNLELLLAAGRHDEAWPIAGGIVESIRRDGWLFGLPGSIETPGLMTGLAGVGYGLARLARPEAFPDLLTLASPA